MLPPPRHKARRQAKIPLTPLIDIVFLLLIYFLLTTNFIVEEEIGIDLPRAEASAPRMQAEITVTVDRHGKIFFEGRETVIDALLPALRQAIDPGADTTVVVKADREVALRSAVQVMDIARAAGAARLSLATERDF